MSKRERDKRLAVKPLVLLPKEEYKFCTLCKIEKLISLENFALIKNLQKYNSRCKECVYSEYKRKNPNKRKWSTREGYKYCRGKCGLELPIGDFRLHRNKPYSYCKKCELEKCRSNPMRRVTFNIRTRASSFLFSKKIKKCPELGCTKKHLKIHLRKQFLPGMMWKNYGEWHIDHYYPLSKAFKQGKEIYALACNFKNLRPMWAKDNISKHAKIPKEFEDVENFKNYIKGNTHKNASQI